MKPSPDPGSFRDPSGRVFNAGDRIFRTVQADAAHRFCALRDSGLLAHLEACGLLLPSNEVDPTSVGFEAADPALLLEHPRIPLVSYPYEWSFRTHQAAALLHLDVHLAALDRNFSLVDATAYNVQFVGPRPVFIDHLSFVPYRDGDVWLGHRQFCTQFLNPLLMHARLGLRPNAWFRGALEGIDVEDMARLVPWHAWGSPTVLTHVLLQARLQRRNRSASAEAEVRRRAHLPKSSFVAMLRGLREFIADLRPRRSPTEWSDYATNNSYSAGASEAKEAEIQRMVQAVRPDVVWDIGCNTGNFSLAALGAGAGTVIGWDFDHGAVDQAFARAQSSNSNFLPLLLDAANPSPNQGWNQRERKGLAERAEANAVLALALAHHLVLSRSIPPDHVLEWLIALAPTGIIELPSDADPMVQRLTASTSRYGLQYRQADFLEILRARSRIVAETTVNDGKRKLVWYERP